MLFTFNFIQVLIAIKHISIRTGIDFWEKGRKKTGSQFKNGQMTSSLAHQYANPRANQKYCTKSHNAGIGHVCNASALLC